MRVLLLLVALAGCVSTPLGATPGPVRFGFDGALTIPLDCHVLGCFEPTVAADLEGRIFVSAIGSGLAAGSAAGAFKAVASPPLPVGAPAFLFQDDVLLQVDPAGRLYYSALLEGEAGWGVQVARSDDGAHSWAVNAWVSPLSGTPSPGLDGDRQWLGFAPSGDVYLSFAQWAQTTGTLVTYAPGVSYVPVGLWSARSTDGGRTFGTFVLVSNYLQRFEKNGNGPPVVDATGRLYVPFLASQPEACVAACQSVPVGAGRVAMAISDDFGASFHVVNVTVAAGPAAGGWLPEASVGPQGELFATWWAWAQDHAVAMASHSRDHGATWSTPTVWSASGLDVTASPWIVAGPGANVTVAYFGLSGKGNVSLAVDRGQESGGTSHVVVATGLHGGAGRATNTDFAHAALLPDGRLVVAWSDPKEGATHVAIQSG
ncbi:MAG: sialidase family protein [Thermoplasmatota archaeon]